MSCDLLPEWLNLFLDDVETSLCLPILLVIVLCTIQFIVNHAVDIGFTFYQNIKQKSEGEEDQEDVAEKEKGEGLMDRIKGLICNAFGHAKADSKSENTFVAQPQRPSSREEEWDYCEEDDD